MAALVAMLFVAATPQPAAAQSTRTVHGTTSCYSGIVPFGFNVAVDGVWSGADTSVQLPGTQRKVWTKEIPTTATSLALDSYCYYSWGEYNGIQFWPYGTWRGTSYSITPGTSTVNTRWYCDRYPIGWGQWERDCVMDSATYG